MSILLSDRSAQVEATSRSVGRAAARCLFLLSPSEQKCGVEDFARLVVASLQSTYPQEDYKILPVAGRWRDLPMLLREIAKVDRVVFSVPLLAWRRLLVMPLVIALVATLMRCRITVFMHEWSALNPLRRLPVAPLVWVAESIIVVSPLIASQLAKVPWLFGAGEKCRLVPNAPTIRRSSDRDESPRYLQLRGAAAKHDIVLGSFGAIYRGKAATALLEIGHLLRQRGINALCVFVGSFTKSIDGYEQDFWSKVAEYGLEDHVIVTGYVSTGAELYTLFEAIDAFLFLFPEGLTARRSSVIHCLQSDRPVVVTAPHARAEFAHHKHFAAQVEAGGLSFVRPGADLASVADQLLAVARQPRATRSAIDPDAWWEATTTAVHAALTAH